MATPVPTVEIAFGANWDDTSPTWVDVTADLLAVGFDRRFSWETGLYSGGQCAVTLTDTEGTYDPFNTAGAYYGNFVPGMQVRVTEAHSATTYTLWRGFVSTFERAWSPLGSAQMVFTCRDGWARLAASNAPPDGDQQLTSERVSAILDAVGWPASLRAIDTGLVTMPAETIPATSTVTLLGQCVTAETGACYIDRQGQVTFDAKDAITSTRQTVDQATLSNVAGDSSVIRYWPPAAQWDDSQVVNSATVTRYGATSTEVTYVDTTSIGRYGYQARTYSAVRVLDQTEAESLAQYIVDSRAYMLAQMPPVTFDVLSDTSTEHEHLCARDLRDRVRWKFAPPDGTTTIDKDFLITGVSQRWSQGAPWEVTWDIVDADVIDRLNASNWLLADNATKGQADEEVWAY